MSICQEIIWEFFEPRRKPRRKARTMTAKQVRSLWCLAWLMNQKDGMASRRAFNDENKNCNKAKPGGYARGPKPSVIYFGPFLMVTEHGRKRVQLANERFGSDWIVKVRHIVYDPTIPNDYVIEF